MKKKLAIFTLINLGIATLAAMAPIALIAVANTSVSASSSISSTVCRPDSRSA